MSIRKAFIWFILSIISFNISILFLGKKLDIYKEDAWYSKWYYWIIAFVFGFIPGLIMLFILVLQTNVKIALKIGVSGGDIYGCPYIWIGCLIIPILGWSIFIIMMLYIYICYIIGLFNGKFNLI